jgi:hypothetical protein
MKPTRRVLYYLIVWVPVILSARANILDGIYQSWPVGEWLSALVFWSVGSVLWVALCAGVAAWVARVRLWHRGEP